MHLGGNNLNASQFKGPHRSMTNPAAVSGAAFIQRVMRKMRPNAAFAENEKTGAPSLFSPRRERGHSSLKSLRRVTMLV
jgi:hypothetical protein